MSDDLTCECSYDPSNPEQVEHCPQHGNVRLFAELLAEAKRDIAALTAERDARPSPLTLRAEMARHGLLPHQTAPYVTSDRGTVDPIKDDPGNVRHFVGWLSQFAPVPEGPTDVEDFYAEAKREDSPWTG